MATFVLLLWPLVALALFASLGREKGLMWVVVAGYLLLPEKTTIELPGLPDYYKTSAIALSAFLGFVFFREKRSWPETASAEAGGADPMAKLFLCLLGVFAVGAAMTVVTNGNRLVDGDRVRRGLEAWDWVNMVSNPIFPVVGFLLAWLWLRSPRHHEELLKIIVICGLVYSLAAIFEMRFSPQLNVWVYGFFPHDWAQHIRGGDFRPVVFLKHGLWLAFFLLSAALAAFGLYRTRTDPGEKMFYLGAGLFIIAVMFVSPNLGAAMLGVLFAPFVLFSPRAIQVRVAMVIALIFLTFPAIRSTLPLNSIVNLAASISAERAASLQFRINQEDTLLERANNKPLFGWGIWGRSRVISEKGQDITVVDGFWIAMLGVSGWIGYVAYFGLLTIPVLLLARARRKKEMSAATATLAIIGAANLVYLIPNSAISPIGWMLAGAVAGFVSWRPAMASDAPSQPEQGDLQTAGSGYTRFAHGQRNARPYNRPQSRPVTRRAVSDRS